MPRVVEVVERIVVPDFPEIELPGEDGFPLESNWHRIQINLLVESVHQHWRGRTDFFAGGNMFLYYSRQQIQAQNYKGPDFLVVKSVAGTQPRSAWVVWEEDGRFPDVIVELLSPRTAAEDLGSKKDLYEKRFKTPEYYCYDPETRDLMGWRLDQHLTYTFIVPNEHGHLWSEQLDTWLGLWEGTCQGVSATWVRLFNARKTPGLTGEEAEHARADLAEAEAERLRADLERLTGKTD